ncbi:capsule assembly Wzi family protein [Thiohalorhabdus denitrificans]|uniref:Capsule assembly protein Wzi n=1 Tax=Thiohalorhabdus denitrificans TaxID=381306 RepID=A0A1G5C647_9GAMM|nr:capsule assembly Wzi family protein [Thiohalorhabdus denitrificans]SCX97882.1 Capsule assembly protein Wzi [Thiohalorhabdus denitrificans]
MAVCLGAVLLGGALPGLAQAGPFAYPGDIRFRHQVQYLKDTGRTDALTTTWPMSLPDVAKDFAGRSAPQGISAYDLHNTLADRLRREARTGMGDARVSLAVLEDPILLRTFEDTPRGRGELEARVEWMGDRFAARLQAQAVRDAPDDKDYRLDGSYLGAVVGNWTLTAGAIPRWWGPGWSGSLILSNNARPVPGVAIERNYTDPFDLPVLRWLGPWDLSVFMGRLESDRSVPRANLVGMRLAFQPAPVLEIGLSRTIQWGGKGRPEDLETFGRALAGQDNPGSEGVDADNEPGNQLAGFDFRLASPYAGFPVALYGQAIGEDEAGGLPTKWMAQAGLETWGAMPVLSGTFRLYAEAVETSLYDSDQPNNVLFNTGYEHHVYQDGYRYRGRSLGHSADNDTTLTSLGGVFALSSGMTWHTVLRWGKINRDGAGGNPLFPEGADLYGGSLSGEVPTGYGAFKAGVEVHRVDPHQDSADTDRTVFFRWRWSG